MRRHGNHSVLDDLALEVTHCLFHKLLLVTQVGLVGVDYTRTWKPGVRDLYGPSWELVATYHSEVNKWLLLIPLISRVIYYITIDN